MIFCEDPIRLMVKNFRRKFLFGRRSSPKSGGFGLFAVGNPDVLDAGGLAQEFGSFAIGAVPIAGQAMIDPCALEVVG
jgi:hypothetical protein